MVLQCSGNKILTCCPTVLLKQSAQAAHAVIPWHAHLLKLCLHQSNSLYCLAAVLSVSP